MFVTFLKSEISNDLK